MQLTLIRHTSVDVLPNICYGQSDVDVSENFIHEAEIVKTQLQKMKFDKIYCSPLSRCDKLAKYCGYNNPHYDKRLLEINFGDWELKNWDDINDPQLEKWYRNWISEVPTHGESFIQMVKRVNDFISEIRDINSQNIAIFTHSGVIRIVEILLKNLSIEKTFDIKVEYGQIVVLST